MPSTAVTTRGSTSAMGGWTRGKTPTSSSTSTGTRSRRTRCRDGAPPGIRNSGPWERDSVIFSPECSISTRGIRPIRTRRITGPPSPTGGRPRSDTPPCGEPMRFAGSMARTNSRGMTSAPIREPPTRNMTTAATGPPRSPACTGRWGGRRSSRPFSRATSSSPPIRATTRSRTASTRSSWPTRTSTGGSTATRSSPVPSNGT